jgi:ornithine cyclodeaminase/alanine dehydrogenase-like protein (mu-crystallin family)
MDAITRFPSFSIPSGNGAPAPANTLLLSRGAVHAQRGEIVAGMRPGHTRDDEIIVFDSTGTALQDVAAAAAVYRRALGQQQGVQFSFNA